LKFPKINFGNIALSVYSALGLCVLLLTNALWYEGSVELGLPTPSGYEFSLHESASACVTSVLLLFLTLLVISFFEKRMDRLRDRQKTETRVPFTVAVTNALVTFVFYVLILYMAIRKFVLSGFALIFDFTVSGVVGMSTYLHFILPLWENRTIRKQRNLSEIEALKLEYDWCWKIIQGIYWAAILIVASGWFFWWMQYSMAAIPVSEWGSFATAKLTTAIAMQMMYIGLGLWFGIIGKLVGISRNIPEKIRLYESRK